MPRMTRVGAPLLAFVASKEKRIDFRLPMRRDEYLSEAITEISTNGRRFAVKKRYVIVSLRLRHVVIPGRYESCCKLSRDERRGHAGASQDGV